MKNILITGGAGFIGIHLINELRNNYNIYVIDLPKKINKNLINLKGCKLIKKDISDRYSFKVLEKIKFEKVYHLAAKTSTSVGEQNPEDCFRTNITGTKYLYDWCKINRPKEIIFASSMAVYGKNAKNIKEESVCNPISFYGISKFAGERILSKLTDFKLKVRIVRLFNVYGEGQDFDNLLQGMLSIYVAQIIKTKKVYVTGGLQRARDFIHVKDVIKALNLKIKFTNNLEILNIGSGKPTTVQKLLSLIFKITNTKKKIYLRNSHLGDTQISFADNKKIKSYGWKNRVQLKKGLLEVIKDFNNKQKK